MKAFILVGGFGTRLRPLTMFKPKSVVDFVNKPILEYQIEALSKVGVKEVVLGMGFQKESLLAFTEQLEKKYNVKIVCSIEDKPLGVAAPMKLAEKYLVTDNPEGLFFLVNSDVITDFKFDEMKKVQKEKDCLGVMCVTKVKDPSRYGVVAFDEQTNMIKSFHEKPKVFIGDCINAGIYLFQTKLLDRLSLSPPTSMVTFLEDLVKEKQFFTYVLPEYWMDIGVPVDFLEGQKLHMAFMRKQNDAALAKGENIIGNVVIHPTATVDPSAVLGPDVVIGEKCVIKAGARIKNSSIFAGATVDKSAVIDTSIVSWQSTVGAWARLDSLTVIAEECQIAPEVYLQGALVLPNKSVPHSIHKKGTVVM